MEQEVLLTTIENDILHIKLNRPSQLNALNQPLLLALQQTFNQAETDTAINAVLLSGNGKAFCAGADINRLADLNGIQGLAFARFGQAVFNQLESLSKPSVAMIHGYALGGGLELAMAATLRIAETNTQFAQPEVKLGVIPGYGGTQRLARLVGKGRALHLCLTGKRISTTEALQWGLINEEIRPEHLQERARALLTELMGLPPIALRAIRDVINHGYDLPLKDALELEAQHFALCCTTQDKQAGVRAFLDKKKPNFKGN